MSFLGSLEKMLLVLRWVRVCVCLHVYHIHLSNKMKENNIKFGIPLFHESKEKKKKKKKDSFPSNTKNRKTDIIDFGTRPIG